MKRFLTILTLTASLLAACQNIPAPIQSTPTPITSTDTPTVIGTWKMTIGGVVYDTATSSPIAGASVRYVVVHSYFREIQEGWLQATVSDGQGRFILPMIVHDTDNIHIVVEAPGYQTYDEKLNLFGDRKLDIGLTPG